MLIYNKEKVNEIFKDLNINKDSLDNISNIDFASLLKEHNWELFDCGSDREVYKKESYDTVIKIDCCGNLGERSIQGEIECKMFEHYGDEMAQIYGASEDKTILFCELVYAYVSDLDSMEKDYPNSNILKNYYLSGEDDYEDFFEEYVEYFFPNFNDMHKFNVGINKKNNLVVLDAGYGDADEIILSSIIYSILKNNIKSNLKTLNNGRVVRLIESLEKGNELTVQLMKKYFPNFGKE